MSAEYREECMLSVWDEFLPLFAANYDAAKDFSELEFAPSKEHYQALKDCGALRMYTMRIDGIPAGYALFTVALGTHLSKTLHAYHDALFISPEHRVGTRGTTLILFAEEQLKHLGVTIVYQHTKHGPDRDHGALLARLGYKPVEMVYAKRLDS